MSLLGRLRMLGSSKIFLLSCKLSGAQRLPMQPCQTANTPAIQLQGQRIGAGAEGPVIIFAQPLLLHLGIQQERACCASKAIWLISLATTEV